MSGNCAVFPKTAALPRWIALQCKPEKPIVKKTTDLTRPIVAQVLFTACAVAIQMFIKLNISIKLKLHFNSESDTYYILPLCHHLYTK